MDLYRLDKSDHVCYVFMIKNKNTFSKNKKFKSIIIIINKIDLLK